MILSSLIAILIYALLALPTVFAQDATPEVPPEIVLPTETPIPVPTLEAPTPTPELPAPTLAPPTPTLPPPALRAEASLGWTVGLPGEIAFILDTTNSAPINSLDAHCTTTPAGLTSAQISAGSFAPDAVVVNGGVQSDGTWVFAVAQPSVPLGGMMFRLAAVASASGAVSLQCIVTGVGMDGLPLMLPFAPPLLIIADAPTALPSETPTPTPMPDLTLTPTVEMTAETTPTPEATLTAIPSLTPDAGTPAVSNALLPGSIAGQVALSHAPPQGVVVSLRDAGGTVVMLVNADDAGAFRFDALSPGAYLVIAEAPGYLRAALPLTIDQGGAALGTLVLYAGDLVASEPPIIDELDVVQFTAWYGGPTLYDPRGDFNRDGQIDILDLRALAQNLRRAG